MAKSQKPLSRKDDIVVQEMNGEVLIYDLRENKAFCLNETAALVWQACDGKRTVAEIGTSVGNEDLVWLALDQLKKENLIVNEIESKFGGLSRREAVKRVGLSSVLALPVIASLVTPTAAQTGTCTGTCVCDANGSAGICSTAGIGGVPCANTNCRCNKTNSGNDRSGTCVV